MKILLSAYACEPGKGSEPGVGWNWTQQMARFADEVWVITRANNREAIETSLEQEPLPNVYWIYFDLPRWARFWKKGQYGVHFYYYLWQIGIYSLCRRLHRQVGFDLVHHLTFGAYWMPSFLALLPIPFVWGPVGGGESTPKSFYRTFSQRGCLDEYARSIARWLGEHDPSVRITVKRARLVLAKAKETAQRLKSLGAYNVKVMSEVAWTEEEIRQLAAVPLHTDNSFRLLSLGRLLHWKGFNLGIMAFAHIAKEFPQVEYWIVGHGPERKNLERLAKEVGVADKVRFLGALPRAEALHILAECDVLVHPSLHDSGGWVCVEAMATGRPVICLDLGGPALQVTEETGFNIPAHTPEQAVAEIAEAMLKLIKDPDLRRRMGEAGQKRVKEEFVWEKRLREVSEYYREIVKKW